MERPSPRTDRWAITIAGTGTSALGLVTGSGMLITSVMHPATHLSLAGIVVGAIVCVVSIMAGATVAIVRIRTDRPVDIRFAETQRVLAEKMEDARVAMVLSTAGMVATSRQADTRNQAGSLNLLKESGKTDSHQIPSAPVPPGDKPLRVVSDSPNPDGDGLMREFAGHGLSAGSADDSRRPMRPRPAGRLGGRRAGSAGGVRGVFLSGGAGWRRRRGSGSGRPAGRPGPRGRRDCPTSRNAR